MLMVLSPTWKEIELQFLFTGGCWSTLSYTLENHHNNDLLLCGLATVTSNEYFNLVRHTAMLTQLNNTPIMHSYD